MTNPVQDALQSATDTVEILVGTDVVGRTGEVFAQHFPGHSAVVIADGNTWALAGDAVTASLLEAGVSLEEPLVFPASPTVYAGYENVVVVREWLARGDACAVSIGSGTLNDLTKLASGELGRPYLNVCTAASMDGYAAFGAAISKDGFKITRNCPAPRALVADMRLLATAPQRMLANGYGDLIEKFPGGADWIVADELGIEPIDQHTWSMVQDPLRAALGDPEALLAGDLGALQGLTDEIMLSGLAIQAHQSSRPGSGAGHNFSHQWEMEGHGLDWDPPLSHGAKVGLGTLAVSALYDLALGLDLADVDAAAVQAHWPTPEQNEQRVRALHDVPVISDAAVTQSMGKYLPAAEVPARIATIKDAWPRIVERCRAQLWTADEVRDHLQRIGGVRHPAQIDISMAKLHRTYLQAQTIRSRYTIMDLLYELGLFERLVDQLFAPGGYWDSHREP